MSVKYEEIWQHKIRRDLYVTALDVAIEQQQCLEEGKDLSGMAQEIVELSRVDLEEPANQPLARRFLEKTAGLPQRDGYMYQEPSSLPEIQAAAPPAPELPKISASRADLENKIHGAWLGRCCGCLLGKPVEGWRRPRMWGYLKDSGRWPLNDYFTLRVPAELHERYQLDKNGAFIDTVSGCMPEDDDLNYTTTNLLVMAHSGLDFKPVDVASFWMANIPIAHTYTAERAAYRNFVDLVPPPQSAVVRNPYREWIGAQIRADAFGYVSPGDPRKAAELAWRDACISHVKNGIYGEMWVAAMLAAAFVTNDLPTILSAGLSQIPARSRLAESIQTVMQWKRDGMIYEDAVDQLHQRWDENGRHTWIHTIGNAMVVTIGLLWGELDFERSICRAVQACYDTDCNGATVGSIVGAVLGAHALPSKWTGPIHDTLETGIAGYNRVAISEMARQTIRLIPEG